MPTQSKDILPVPAPPGTDERITSRLKAPYIPTPQLVVDEMLKVAGVSKDDLLYDLGCGDGRIVISAARHYGMHGVGVDTNPRRIEECIENARKAGVYEKVRFLQQNLFDVDFSDATVVTLYLLSGVNLRLRPKLLRDLKPGARIVSYEFGMGEWSPDKVFEVEGYPVYSWTVPAKVPGL